MKDFEDIGFIVWAVWDSKEDWDVLDMELKTWIAEGQQHSLALAHLSAKVEPRFGDLAKEIRRCASLVCRSIVALQARERLAKTRNSNLLHPKLDELS